MYQSGNGNILKLPLRIYIIPYQLRHGSAISSTPFKGKVFSLKKKKILVPVGVLTTGDGECGWACGHRRCVGT